MARGRTSAGLLPYRLAGGRLEVLIAHMGGPYWAKKDEGSWSIVKGEYEQGEDPHAAALREFAEETGSEPPRGEELPLGELRQAGGKRILAWAVESDFDPALLRSNTFTLEWPPRSGLQQEFPEIDRAQWFESVAARRKLLAGQVPFVDALESALRERGLLSG